MSYVNLTSQDAAGLFPQFMYESILQTAIEDPEFEFKTRATPYALQEMHIDVIHRAPAYIQTKNSFTVREVVRNATSLAAGPIFVISACYAIVQSIIMSEIIDERVLF